MIQRLRNRFIRIATLSVAAVMLLLTVILNVANYVSTDADQRELLALIAGNRGTIPVSDTAPADAPEPPDMPEGQTPPDAGQGTDTPPAAPDAAEPGRRDGPFTAETPFSTRYFVLRFQADGTLVQVDLTKIASVTEDDTAAYLTAALEKGEGYGYCGNYRFYVTADDSGERTAIFLDCYQSLRAVRTVLVWSLAADALCTLLVLLLVVLLSRRAIDPVVRSAEQQKQFITDASHELKTPITVIATSLKVLEMEVGRQKWIDKARGQTEKLTALVNSLVTLSRMDEETSPLKREPFPISDAVRETAESFTELAASGGHALTVDVAPDLTCCGDEYAVRQLVSILLDNAVKYAALDSPIGLALSRSRRGVTLSVSNRCEDAEHIDTSRLFDRFYRADPARSGGNGFGIGLSIARGIAEGHRGSIAAAIDGDTITFTAELR